MLARAAEGGVPAEEEAEGAGRAAAGRAAAAATDLAAATTRIEAAGTPGATRAGAEA